ncbi:MAG: ABC transporter ATP-binding protein [Gammaproteobacteria bacterium]|nr:ABC transporter ATP-binding protein [Gammaproteobacteria bacterium]
MLCRGGSSFHTPMYWLLEFIRPHRARLAFILVLSLLSTLLALAQPYLTKFLIDDGLLSANMSVVLWLCGLMVAATLVAAALGAVNRWHYVDVSARILFALRNRVFDHLMRLSPRYYNKTRGGDIIARIDGDIAEIQRFAVDTLLATFNGVIALLGALMLMFSLSWRLSLVALIALPVNAVFLRYMRPRIERGTRRVRERSSDVLAFFVDVLAAMKLVQAAGAERRESVRLDDLQQRFRHDTLRLQMVNYSASTIPGLVIMFATATVFVAGGYLTISGELTLGTLIAFTAYMARANGPVQTLQGIYVAMQRALVSLARVQAITQQHPDVEESPQPRDLPDPCSGAIEFRSVSFTYGGDDSEVLRGVDIRIPAGLKTVIIGESGIGKSTLVDLLHRHYDPDAGRIFLDGMPIRDLRLRDLRRRVAVVAQDAVLLPGSVLENVRYANTEASDAEVHEALRIARVDSFLPQLPDAEHTQVGTRGMSLSGGQRQRITIARALLQDPAVLVLDEATSAVDPDTEREIAAEIDAIFGDRTRLIITHRPQLAANFDLLLRLERDGTIQSLTELPDTDKWTQA